MPPAGHRGRREAGGGGDGAQAARRPTSSRASRSAALPPARPRKPRISPHNRKARRYGFDGAKGPVSLDEGRFSARASGSKCRVRQLPAEPRQPLAHLRDAAGLAGCPRRRLPRSTRPRPGAASSRPTSSTPCSVAVDDPGTNQAAGCAAGRRGQAAGPARRAVGTANAQRADVVHVDGVTGSGAELLPHPGAPGHGRPVLRPWLDIRSSSGAAPRAAARLATLAALRARTPSRATPRTLAALRGP